VSGEILTGTSGMLLFVLTAINGVALSSNLYPFLPSSRQHLRYDVCLEAKTDDS